MQVPVVTPFVIVQLIALVLSVTVPLPLPNPMILIVNGVGVGGGGGVPGVNVAVTLMTSPD